MKIDFSRIHNSFSHWLSRWQPSEGVILIGIGMVVGLTTGAGVYLFKRLVDLLNLAFFNYLGALLEHMGAWAVMLVPTLGGLLVGLFVYFFIGDERHHGVAGIIEAAALAGGRLRYYRVPAKVIASALSLGAGASVGPEDPSVQIGAGLGSMFGQKLQLSDERVRSLVAAGSASGIAAAFNAPIAGVFFALEIILGEISGGAFGIVVLASVISSLFTQAVAGREPAFHVPAYAFGSTLQIPLYFGLGLLAGPVSVLYIRLLYLVQDNFHDRINLPVWVKPAIAGVIVGVVGIFMPQIFGVGYDTIGNILIGNIAGFWLLGALLLGKLILTPVSIGGGFQGGVFAPSLFIGAALGAAYGVGANLLFPSLGLIPGAFAMVGMAAVLAGSVHAPLTAVLLLFEMTNDYRIILPLMFAVVVSMILSQRLETDSIYTLSLTRKGIRLERGRDVDVLEMITVGEVMSPVPETLSESDSFKHVSEVFAKTRHHGLPVLNDQGEITGVLTISDLARAQDGDTSSLRAADLDTRDMITAYSDETIGEALRSMGSRGIGRMPVVSRNNPREMVGWLSRADLLRAYDVALTKRASQRHRAHQVRLGAVSGGNVRVFEFPIEKDSALDGKRVKEISWPPDCLVASLRRGRNVIIPHGDTVLHAGNTLVVVTERGAEKYVASMCQADHKVDAQEKAAKPEKK